MLYRRVLLAVAVSFLLMFIPICTGADVNTVTIAQGQTFFSLDGGIDAGRNNMNILLSIYDNLFSRNEQGSIVPNLAEGYRLIDPTTWRLTLRKGVKFHNGDPFTAKDVKFSIDRVLDPALASQQRTYYTAIKEVKIIDDFTVDVITKYPDSTIIERLALFPVVPQKYTTEVGAAKLGTNPVGTGPYIFETWVKDSYVSMLANPYYWGGKPSIDRLVFRQIPDDNTRVASLLSGEVDIITAVPPERIQEITKKTNLRADVVPSIRGIMIYINTLQGPFSDVRVRQALNYAVDVPEIIEAILGGNGWPITNSVPSMYLGYDKTLKGYTYNLTKAKQLLAEAGFAKGLKIRMHVPVGRYLKDVEVGQAVAGQLARAGFEVEVQLNEWTTHISLMRGLKDRKDDPPTLLFMGYGAPVFDLGLPWDEFLGTNSKSGLWRNQEFNSLVNKGMAETDIKEKTAIYNKAHALLIQEAPMIFMYQQADVYGVNTRVNWKARSDEGIFLFKTTASNK